METLEILKLTFTAFGLFISLMIITKLVRVRSIGKISTTYFVAAISILAVLVSVLSSNKYTFFEGSAIVAIVTIFQILFVSLLRASKRFNHFFINKAKIVLWNGKILEDRLVTSNISKEDLIAKIGRSNPHDFRDIKAVILEDSGEFSVIYNQETQDLNQSLLNDANI
ncbi:YetF domain-containing protein [Kordia algicida OT-1]|uniref:Membrane protein-like protein n=1 Tax=Kordia algicida OT-1 TaxID=391587 RepID=A9DVR9_9FLAO|nr:YetF domain-containing protein [Kordia algicida]EDP96458.1 membrane protein-like protein [Kordia algicida OT-1]